MGIENHPFVKKGTLLTCNAFENGNKRMIENRRVLKAEITRDKTRNAFGEL